MLIPSLGYADSVLVELTSDIELTSLKPGDIFTVNINAKNLESFVGGEIIVSYDSSVIELVDKTLAISSSTDFTNIDTEPNPNLKDSPGKTMFIFGVNKDVSPLTGNQLIGSLTFKALSKGTETIEVNSNSKIIYEDASGNYIEVPYSTSNLSYNIVGIGSISGRVIDNTGNGIGNIVVELVQDNSVVYSTTTSQDGSYNINGITEGIYTLQINSSQHIKYSEEVQIYSASNANADITLVQLVEGDVTKDGIVDLEDLVFTANYFGFTSLDAEWDENTEIADVNNDSKVDVIDLIIITRNLSK